MHKTVQIPEHAGTICTARRLKSDLDMDVLFEIIGAFFFTIFGLQTDRICKDRELPAFVGILFLVLAACVIAGLLFFCWKISKF